MLILMPPGGLWSYPWGSKDSLSVTHDSFMIGNTKDSWTEPYKAPLSLTTWLGLCGHPRTRLWQLMASLTPRYYSLSLWARAISCPLQTGPSSSVPKPGPGMFQTARV